MVFGVYVWVLWSNNVLKIKPLQKVFKPIVKFIDWLNDGDTKRQNQKKITKRDTQKGEGNSKHILDVDGKKIPDVSQESSIQAEQMFQSMGDHNKQLPNLQSGKNCNLEEAAEKLSEDNGSDFLLDIPLLNMQEIKMNVDNLNGRVALRADLADFIKIDIGAQVDIAKVDLDIKGIEVQAACKVKLKKVYSIFTRALESIDKNPELLQNLLKPAGEVAGSGSKDIKKTTAMPGESEKGRETDSVDKFQGIRVKKGELGDSVRDISKGVNRSVDVSSNVYEKKRDKLFGVDK